ncbi:hypothetical protein [Bacillus swezeyi]|uniref:hypothetical protein n=1 Tax=Bacillus swezeyi TaxID=1925020 RepID=UPI0027DB9C53|nr:hypothetical protein [Bacillus swezeyi]
MKLLTKGLVASFLFTGIFAISGNPLQAQAQEFPKAANHSVQASVQGIFAPQAVVINRPMRVGQEDQYVGITNVSYSGSAITVRITSDRVYVKAVRPGKAIFSYRNTLGEMIINNITVNR